MYFLLLKKTYNNILYDMLIRKIRPYFFNFSELKHFLNIAFPMIISTGTTATMMFFDRLFLSQYSENSGEAYLNASLIGSVTSFVIISFFFVTAGYSNALVAQYYGADNKKMCSKVIHQVIFFSLLVYPIILILNMLVPYFFNAFNHSPLQTKLETTYTRILLLGALFPILSNGIGGFFIGIHKTRIIMTANLIGLFINIPFNYILIFGIGIIPPLGVAGAAIATILSSIISMVILLMKYYSKKIDTEFSTRSKPIFNKALFNKILYFGTPSGVETVFSVLAFNFFVAVMSSYGEIAGAATTIAINWDSMSFIPMIGAGFATTAVVGQHMGAKDIFKVKRAVFLSCVVTFAYALIMSLIMFLFTSAFVEIFLGKMQQADTVRPMAIVMLRLACGYLLFDAITIIISGALRGAGDTRAVMMLYITIDLIFGVLIYIFAMNQIVSPLGAWFLFIGFAISLASAMLIRFFKGHWQHITVIE